MDSPEATWAAEASWSGPAGAVLAARPAASDYGVAPRTKLKVVDVGTKTLAPDADILLKRAGVRTVVAAMAADPPVTATVRPAVYMEMSCRVKPPPAAFVSMTVALEPGGMDRLPGTTVTLYCVPTGSWLESIGWMMRTTTVPAGEVF